LNFEESPSMGLGTETAGRVLLAMMQIANATTPRELSQKPGLVPKRFCQ